MNERDFCSAMTTTAPALSDEQRRLVWQFAAAVSRNGGIARTHDRRERLERERAFEEAQLCGADLERRRREPA
jgi:hypothetical protein